MTDETTPEVREEKKSMESTEKPTERNEVKAEEAGEKSSGIDLGVEMSKAKMIMNLIVISFSFLLLFTAYQTTASLQSTLNSQGNLGTHSQIAVYVALMLSCFFLPKPVIKYLGYKWSIVVAMCCYIGYTAAQFYPRYYTLIPTGLILGTGAAFLWGAKCSYLTDLGAKYAEVYGEDSVAVVTRFFGIFFCFFQLSGVVGNVVSSQVLVPDNETEYDIPADVLALCGANFCNDRVNFTNPKLERPDEKKIYILSGVLVASAVSATLLLAFAVTNIKSRQSKDDKAFSFDLFLATFMHLKKPEQLLVIPLTMFSGFEQAFILVDYTQSYIACTLGIWKIGYVLLTYAAVDSVMSFLTGIIVKFTGRIPVFVAGAVANTALIIALLLWVPKVSEAYVLYLVAAVWGLSDAVWQTQINALYGCLFGNDSEAAFSNYRMWESLGFIIMFAINGPACADVKLYLLLAVLVVAMAGYFACEWRLRRQKHQVDSH